MTVYVYCICFGSVGVLYSIGSSPGNHEGFSAALGTSLRTLKGSTCIRIEAHTGVLEAQLTVEPSLQIMINYRTVVTL